MKAIHEQNLKFIKAVVDRDAAICEEVFIAHKYDIRLALFDLLKPEGQNKENLLQVYASAEGSERLALLDLIFQHFCPNPLFKAILLKLKRGHTPKLDQRTASRLEEFRRGPNKKEVNLLFDVLNPEDIEVGAALLDKLRSFGREIEHQLDYIMMMGEAEDPDLVKNALMLIPHIPGGIEKALALYWRYLGDEKMRFHALNALQAARGLNPDLLFKMFEPILADYERLCRTEGEMNDLWPEVNMIKSILSKNGGAGRVWMVGRNLGWKK
jgi:hypothetical protein